jgi:hypothetical protein
MGRVLLGAGAGQRAIVSTSDFDKAIRNLPLQARWKSDEQQAVSFGRVALQVALQEAARLKGRRRDDEFKYFQTAAELTRAAHQALQRLLKHIGPTGLRGREYSQTLVSKGRRLSIRDPRRTPAGDHVDHKKEAETLAAACPLICGMHRYASAQSTKLHDAGINDRDYGKIAFVYRLAESWIFLTGKRPGGGKAINPFLRFVDEAAATSGRFKKLEDFYSAMTWALKELKLREAFDPKGETQQSISGIAARGPVWWEEGTKPAEILRRVSVSKNTRP